MRARNLMTISIVLSRYVKTNSQEVAMGKRCAVCEGAWQGAPGSFTSPLLCVYTLMGPQEGRNSDQKTMSKMRQFFLMNERKVRDDGGPRVADQSRTPCARSRAV